MTITEVVLLGGFILSILINTGIVFGLIGRSMELEYRLGVIEKILQQSGVAVADAEAKDRVDQYIKEHGLG